MSALADPDDQLLSRVTSINMAALFNSLPLFLLVLGFAALHSDRLHAAAGKHLTIAAYLVSHLISGLPSIGLLAPPRARSDEE